MLSKIKNNLHIIYLVLGIVALSLVISPISSIIKGMMNGTISGDFLTYSTFSLITYGGIAVSSILFIVMGARRILDKYLLITVIITYFLTASCVEIYDLIKNDNYSNVFYILINVLLIVFMILSITDKRYMLTSLIIILVDSAPLLLDVFGSSQLALAQLIINALLLAGIYFYGTFGYSSDSYYS